ncbi:MAG: hypothetical protein LBS69_09645, partial [Prevotellaceae bacterium]|nr:hypothetical protein [Prevotellaceae bacterium]
VNTNELQARLNEIYNPVGVTFAIETDTFTYNSAINFFDETSGWFSRYTAAMKTFNIAYRENIGERYDKDKTYLFILGEDASLSDRDAQGFMPLGGRFGYLFKNQIPASEIHTIAAHELGHGIWALKHTFDNDYGNIAAGTTNNLMDYTSGATHLAKWQWEIIRYPALFTDPFGGDEEGMADAIITDDATITDDITDKQKSLFIYSKHRYYKIKFNINVIKKDNNRFELNNKDYKIIYTVNSGKFFGIYDADGVEKLLTGDNIIKGKDLFDAIESKKITEYPKNEYYIEEQILSSEQITVKNALLAHNNTDLVNEIIVLMNNITKEDFNAIFSNDYNPDSNDNSCVFNFTESRQYTAYCLNELIDGLKNIETKIIRKTVKINGSDVLLVFRSRRSNEHPRIENKIKLEYSHVCFNQNYSITYFLLSGVDAVVMRTDNEDGTDFEYAMTVDNGANWDVIYMDEFENDDLIEVFKQIEIEIAKGFVRYIIPVENVYILISGEDFDGEESSRLVAGGFLVLEFIQAGKILKFIKGTKILTRTGQAVNVGKRVMWQATKKITETAAANICAQFTVNLITNIVKYAEDESVEASDIVYLSLNEISITDALWAGVFSFTSLSEKEKNWFTCARDMLKAIEDNSDNLLKAIEEGTLKCGITFGTSFALKYLRNTDGVQKLIEALQKESSWNILAAKLLQLMDTEFYNEFMQTLVEEGIKNASEIIWAE